MNEKLSLSDPKKAGLQREVEAAIKRIAEIDAMFESATGWGSWMVMCANEREDLANKFGFEHKWLARCGEERTD